jgi:phenylacetate-coenzyme A ligase PaaK-like adenylate-forming protein
MLAPTAQIYKHFLDLLDRGADGPRAGTDAEHGSEHARYGEWFDASGQSHAAFLTRDGWVLNQIGMAECFDGILTEDDVVIVAVPYELSFVGAEVERAIELVGSSVIGVGTSNTICPMPRILDLIWQYEATALVCSPTVAANLAALAVSLGRRPEDSSVRLIVSMGEACSPQRLDRVVAAWGAAASTLYGTALTPTVAVPCEQGVLHVCGDRLRAAVRDVQGGQAAASGGLRGELLLASLPGDSPDSESVGTGQLVELGPANGGCACGQEGAVLTPLGRVADAVESPSGLVSAVDVERTVFGFAEFAPRFAGEARNGAFKVTCALEDGELASAGELRRTVEGRVREGLGVDVDIEIVDAKDWEGR